MARAPAGAARAACMPRVACIARGRRVRSEATRGTCAGRGGASGVHATCGTIFGEGAERAM